MVLGYSGGIGEPHLRATTPSFAGERLHSNAASFLQLTRRLAGTFFAALVTGVLLGGGLYTSALRWVLVIALIASAAATLPSFNRPKLESTRPVRMPVDAFAHAGVSGSWVETGPVPFRAPL